MDNLYIGPAKVREFGLCMQVTVSFAYRIYLQDEEGIQAGILD